MRDVTELAAAATGVAHVIEMECSKDFFIKIIVEKTSITKL